MPLLLVHFARFGPYHHARLKSATDALAPLGWEVIGLETAGNDATYAWDETRGEEAGPQVITAFPGRVHEEITSAECKRVLRPLLDELKSSGCRLFFLQTLIFVFLAFFRGKSFSSGDLDL